MTLSIRVGDTAAFPGGAPGQATSHLAQSIHAVPAPPTGTLTGIASGCYGFGITAGTNPPSRKEHVVLYQGLQVVRRLVVTNSYTRQHGEWVDQPFTVNVSPGTYEVVNGHTQKTVQIRPGSTVRVSFDRICG